MTEALSDELLAARVATRREHASTQAAADAIGIPVTTLKHQLKRAAARGMMLDEPPAMPGYEIASVSQKFGGKWIKQQRAPGEVFEIPPTHVTGKITVNRDAEGRVIQDWLRVEPDKVAQLAALRAVVDGLKDELTRATPVEAPSYTIDTLANLYVVTDAHLGGLADADETGNEDWDLKIGEQVVDDWFAAAIDLAPPAETGIFAQLGDLLHWDGFESVTPTNRHVLDGDSRFDKMVRVAIRIVRRIIARLLAKHQRVHILMADANHDPASEAWLRGMLAAFYEDEPRVTVDDSAGTYYAYRHGDVSLFFHHGHRRKIADVDSVFAGRYREMYGNTKYSFAHLGHLHSDELKSTNLMKVERHETLAAPDAYAANGGWLSGRSAKVITYHKEFGEVARLTLTPGMVAGAAKRVAANDNDQRRAAS
ncbi:oxidoreductase [Mesorhizobium sp. M00.F.Ca.ET.217.01.1.1]|uniref:oxidoreductase n=1 Tax=Mesorhizobium sp. M00.F.Ca.ET.217.01.1.1 TaxID=2500529 RepID=UPI000FD6B97D|nr:oxidoreductase [Mesorhizobium sp. M00.F.Ca.ET.217.01.1.1]TGQ19347.1 oxidoreductase [Mesorhizobium sp. M00.F.Ca.ET.217.01.1.1]